MALGGQSRLHAGAELRFGPPHLRRQTGFRADGQTGFRAFPARALNVAEIVHDYNYAQVLTLDLLHKGMRLTAGYGSVGSYVARLFSDFEPTLYDPPIGLGTADDLRDADFVIVCVPTPQLPSGACDTSIVEEVVGLADPRVAIVCHSTIAIGTTGRLIAETSKPLVFVPGSQARPTTIRCAIPGAGSSSSTADTTRGSVTSASRPRWPRWSSTWKTPSSR